MTRPGVVVSSRAELPPRSAPTDAGMAFMVGQTATGTAPKLVTSFTEYQTEFGDRTAPDAFDAAETFFREGGSKLTVSPVATADTTGFTDALDALGRALGPGQVFAPGVPTVSVGGVNTALMAHAATNNRIALLDAASTDDTSDELITLAGTLSASPDARYAALFAPPAIVPGVTAGTTRTVPYSALEAGIMARNDVTHTPNVAAAGPLGISRFAIDLAAAFTDAERQDLNESGVDIARNVYGQIETYGYRTLAPEATGWLSLANARLNMEICAKAEAIGELFMFTQMDGRRVRISQFGAELSGMLIPYYEAGALYGTTAQEAFYVDVGGSVNTDATIAAGELHAVIGVRMSPFAEYVVIEIVKVAADQPLPLAA
jgi:hypothetical protein